MPYDKVAMALSFVGFTMVLALFIMRTILFISKITILHYIVFVIPLKEQRVRQSAIHDYRTSEEKRIS